MALTNTQYDDIMHQYEERRTLHRQELEERRSIVYDNVPGYKELDDEIAERSVSFGKRILSGEMLDRSLLKEEIRRISDRKAMLLRNAGYSEDYLDMGYTCPDCKDTGYIGGEKCHCFKQKIIEALYDNSNLRLLTKQANFRKLSEQFYQGEDLKRFRGAKTAAEDFINNFDSDYQNLFFYGTVGTGKSFLSVCIGGELLKTGHSVIYFSATSLFDMIAGYSFGRGNRDELESLSEDLTNCDLLIIDDLGTEVSNSFTNSKLFSLLNERDIRRKPTIINTNYSLEYLQNAYSDRIFSRITSNYKLLNLTGRDIRIIKNLAKKESEDFR